MSNNGHSITPWRQVDDCILNGIDETIARELFEEDARRIVACVNAFDDIDIEAIEACVQDRHADRRMLQAFSIALRLFVTLTHDHPRATA